MDEEMRRDRANLLQHQYSRPTISAQGMPLDETGDNEGVRENSSDSDRRDSSVFDKEDEKMTDNCCDRIEMTEINQCSFSSPVDEELVNRQPAPTNSIESISTIGQTGIMDRLRWRIDDDDEDDLLIPTRPNKSQVLHYFVKAQTFNVRRVERDFQITDADGFPLFDAYTDSDCVGRIWTLESYGRIVLSMREFYSTDWHRRTTKTYLSLRDWHGEFSGELLPGDPFYIRNSQRKIVAKILRHGSTPSPAFTNACANEELTALTTNTRSGNAAPETPTSLCKPCWICVHEENERHIAILENNQNIQFNKDVPFQLKLLTLAAMIRLVGHATTNPATNCVGIVKTILNCCAGY